MSQQTPSTQCPLPQSESPVHALAIGSAQTPVPAVHTRPPAHDALAQQTPSTQLPLLHSLAAPHAVPLPPIVRQRPPLQK